MIGTRRIRHGRPVTVLVDWTAHDPTRRTTHNRIRTLNSTTNPKETPK